VISARIHAANSQGDRATEGRRRARRHSADSLWERGEFYVMLVASMVLAGARIRSGCVSCSRGVKGARKFRSVDQWAPP